MAVALSFDSAVVRRATTCTTFGSLTNRIYAPPNSTLGRFSPDCRGLDASGHEVAFMKMPQNNETLRWSLPHIHQIKGIPRYRWSRARSHLSASHAVRRYLPDSPLAEPVVQSTGKATLMLVMPQGTMVRGNSCGAIASRF
jgi:hypothetical protein